jgi:hypothetical protein
MPATWPTHHVLFDLLAHIISGDGYTWWSFSLRNFLHQPVTSFLLVPNNLPSTLFSNNLNLMFSPNRYINIMSMLMYQPS